MESFGYHKRDLLVSRVEDARDTQQDAKEQFKSALEKFSEVADFKGGKLEEKYKQLKTELEKSESKAKAVKKRIADVESVAKALFDEWKSELDQYSNEKWLSGTRSCSSNTTSMLRLLHRYKMSWPP
jgi:uncharacterized protein YhaN